MWVCAGLLRGEGAEVCVRGAEDAEFSVDLRLDRRSLVSNVVSRLFAVREVPSRAGVGQCG